MFLFPMLIQASYFFLWIEPLVEFAVAILCFGRARRLTCSPSADDTSLRVKKMKIGAMCMLLAASLGLVRVCLFY